jgi:hypothetical protein
MFIDVWKEGFRNRSDPEIFRLGDQGKGDAVNHEERFRARGRWRLTNRYIKLELPAFFFLSKY